MVARSILIHRLRHPQALSTLTRRAVPFAHRLAYSTNPQPSQSPSNPQAQSSSPAPLPSSTPSSKTALTREPSWLAKKVQQNPTALAALRTLAGLLGYGSKKQMSGRRALVLYERLCVPRADEERAFWQDECHLPPTFQSWFSVTNLHIWMLTVRLRSLPDPYAKHLIQALIDHFFLDVEDRVRAVLQPKNTPRSSLSSSSSSPSASANPTNGSTTSSFYTIANATGENGKPRGNAPERLVTRQMKILKEQWAGLGLSMDYALVKGDAEMAGAVWRNFLGARGARGIVYPSSSSLNSPSSSSPSSTSPSTTSPASTSTQYFRRSVNLSSSTPLPTSPTELEAEERKDDGSGVHDYAPSEAGKYVKYPELMADVVSYVRREVKRLEGVRDEDVLGVWEIGRQGEGWEALRFGRIRE